jgi:hypothetical protein
VRRNAHRGGFAGTACVTSCFAAIPGRALIAKGRGIPIQFLIQIKKEQWMCALIMTNSRANTSPD